MALSEVFAIGCKISDLAENSVMVNLLTPQQVFFVDTLLDSWLDIQYNHEDICVAQFVCNELLGNRKLLMTLGTWLPVFWA